MRDSVEHVITSGSPLDLPHVKYKILPASDLNRIPRIVRRWTKLADRRDSVKAKIYLKDAYKENNSDARVEDEPAAKDWVGIHHKSRRYLRCLVVSDFTRSVV